MQTCQCHNQPHCVIRPPGTLVPEGLMFYCRCFFLFLSPCDLRAHSDDRRETLPHDRNMGALYNASPKFRGTLPPKKLGAKNMQNSARFQTTSEFDREYLRNGISKIGKKTVHRWFLPRSMKKVRWTLVHKLQRTRCEFGPTQIAFFGRLYFVP